LPFSRRGDPPPDKQCQGVEQALRGIIDAGGDIRKDWNLEDALRTRDRAVGVSVLHPLYMRMKDGR
jgi:hypothetical protein